MKRARGPSGEAGVTLVELVVATALSTVALLGVFAIMSSMVNTEVEGMRGATVTAWSMAGINAMNSDIAGASYFSISPAAAGDVLVACTNWSARASTGGTPGPVVTTPSALAGNIQYVYCYDYTDALPDGDTIRRLMTTNAAAACPTAASQASLGCTKTNFPDIVATGVYRSDYLADPPIGTQTIFTYDSANEVRVRFIVGMPASGVASAGGLTASGAAQTSVANPQCIPFDTRIALEGGTSQ